MIVGARRRDEPSIGHTATAASMHPIRAGMTVGGLSGLRRHDAHDAGNCEPTACTVDIGDIGDIGEVREM